MSSHFYEEALGPSLCGCPIRTKDGGNGLVEVSLAYELAWLVARHLGGCRHFRRHFGFGFVTGYNA